MGWAIGGGGVAVVGLLIALVALHGGGSGAATTAATTPTPAPRAAAIDGITCQEEMVQTHFHAHLTLIDSGQTVDLPGGIGIRQDAGCLYWLHTHAADGIIHIESPGRAAFTLGEFFDVWGKPLSSSQAGRLTASSGQTLHVFLNGQPYTGDPRALPLTAHADITIEAGPSVPPPTYAFPAGV